jgi:DNA-binding transcriptional MocR family regulator
MTRNANRVSETIQLATDRIRDFSKLVFGSKYRLEVAARIGAADPRLVYARDLAEALSLTDNLVHPELRHFESAGLLVRLGRPRGQQIQYYERTNSSFWPLARQLTEELQAGSFPSSTEG